MNNYPRISTVNFRMPVCALFAGALIQLCGCEKSEEELLVDRSDLEGAEALIGLEFTDEERELMLEDVDKHRKNFESLRDTSLNNAVRPALFFRPVPGADCANENNAKTMWPIVGGVERPDDLQQLAFYSIAELGELIRTRQVTVTELIELYLSRLRNFGPQLEAVVTLTDERAMKAAARADSEIAAGFYRGPLHGIPYGAKDLLAVQGYKTTWGAMPYKDQVLDTTATVIEKLDEAGAVLVAKLTLGALAWGDVWYGGKTRNPWNLEEGSSGSSAGPAAAVAAGLVPFALGTETWGSIVSPATHVGISGLRPTFGRVSRYGAMALSWSMDKIGPLCRTIEDCAVVFDAIRGCDARDLSVVNAPFRYRRIDNPSAMRVGVLEEAFAAEYDTREQDLAALEVLRDLGMQLVPVALPDLPIEDMSFVLSVEAAAAFDELTRSGQDDLMVRQIQRAWPNVFRAARLIPAVEYVQANRMRSVLISEIEAMFGDVDVIVAPSFHTQLLATNLTGHPAAVVPNGFMDSDSPTSITFLGRLNDEAGVLAVANAFQQATDFHLRHPPAFTGSGTTTSGVIFDAGKVPVGNVYLYTKSNIDGSNSGQIAVYYQTPTTIESFKWRPGHSAATVVVGQIDETTLSVRDFKAYRLQSTGELQQTASLEMQDAQNALISIGGSEQQAIIDERVWHSYDFDFASLGFLFRFLSDKQQPFVFHIADFDLNQEPPEFRNFGSVTLKYLGRDTRAEERLLKYSVDGPGLDDRGGHIWMSETGHHMVGFEIEKPDEPGYASGKLILTEIRTMQTGDWERFKLDAIGAGG